MRSSSLKSKLAFAALLALIVALCTTGGYVAARSLPHLPTGESTTGPPSGSGATVGGLKPPPAPGTMVRRDSLHALIRAAQLDLATASFDPVAAARAAARIAAIEPADIQAAAHVARNDPERGLEWALRIPDEFNRTDALRQVVATWAQTDRVAATAASHAADLDDATRAEVMKSVAP